jgi:enterochelin esterase-like enzyme
MSIGDLLRLKQYFLLRLRKILRFPSPATELKIYSEALGREVIVDVYRTSTKREQAVFLFLDGQDVRRMPVHLIQQQLTRQEGYPPFTVVGIHANADRMREYGTLSQPDYAKRGSQAVQTGRFIREKLLPQLQKKYSLTTNPHRTCVAGFSLGALPPFDLAWHYPQQFGVAGVFSGALWWRSQPFNAKKPDAHRILHTQVENANHLPPIRYWFQAGTEDETEDRNRNGIIDAIDDTLQLMESLRAKGQAEKDMYYHEVPGGRHEPGTWGAALIYFIRWALR